MNHALPSRHVLFAMASVSSLFTTGILLFQGLPLVQSALKGFLLFVVMLLGYMALFRKNKMLAWIVGVPAGILAFSLTYGLNGFLSYLAIGSLAYFIVSAVEIWRKER